jgi:ATP-dependent Zn protease
MPSIRKPASIYMNLMKKRKRILTEQMEKLHQVAGFLLEHETMEAQDFLSIMEEI